MIKAEVRFTKKHFEALATTQKISWFTCFCRFFIFAILSMYIISRIYERGFSWYAFKPLIYVAFIFVVFFLLKYISSPKKQFENYRKNFPNAVNTYCFDEEKFSLHSVSDVSNSNSEHIYETIESAEEKNGFFLLKIKGIGVVIIGLDEIVEGSPEQLRELLKSKLGSKFSQKAK